MPKYHVTLQSGRDFIMKSQYDSRNPDGAYEVAYEAYDEACLMDDYLEDIELINHA
tara:strand:- start:271 stop:438 length:168 start_codon:yes stop_codon:yes gene_type:complete